MSMFQGSNPLFSYVRAIAFRCFLLRIIPYLSLMEDMLLLVFLRLALVKNV